MHLLQSQRSWWTGMGNPSSLSHSLPTLFCLLKLKLAVLHLCKCRFLMFTNNKSKVFTYVNTIRRRITADQEIPYCLYNHVLLFTVSHLVRFCKLLSSLRPVSQDNSKHWNRHVDILNFKPVIIPPRINKNLCCFTLQGCS